MKNNKLLKITLSLVCPAKNPVLDGLTEAGQTIGARQTMGASNAADGITEYYQAKIEELKVTVRSKQQNLRRLEAQRNELNSTGDLLLKSPPSPMNEWLAHNDNVLSVFSEIASRGIAASARTWIICRRSCQSNGSKQSLGQGMLMCACLISYLLLMLARTRRCIQRVNMWWT